MIRGTTAQFKFKIPYDLDFDNDNTYVKVVFWQPGNERPESEGAMPFKKCTKGEWLKWDADKREITVTLQPEETARFMDDRKAKTQISVTMPSGFRFAGEEQLITVYPMFDDSPLGDIVVPESTGGLIILDGLTI